MAFNRTNTSIIGRWWWTVDLPLLGTVLLLMVVGLLLVMAGSPSVAAKLGIYELHFVERHAVFMVAAAGLIFLFSLMPPRLILLLSAVGLLAAMLAMVAVLFIGDETKGATRWVTIAGFSLQPSEFMKPCFAVVMGWLFAERFRNPEFRGHVVAIVLYALIAILLVSQPDIGMTVLLTCIWIGQYFLAGLSLHILLALLVLGVAMFVAGYVFFPHVSKRVDAFLNPDAAGNYQVEKSLEAYRSGGFLGVGPGEGAVKQHLPDSHTDFIFAVAGEEMGMIACIIILGIIGFIVFRGVIRLLQEQDLFIMLAASGLLMEFALQSLINIAVTLNLLPTKGMTLPMISYGGSSMLAYGVAIGMLLALTRRRYGKESYIPQRTESDHLPIIGAGNVHE